MTSNGSGGDVASTSGLWDLLRLALPLIVVNVGHQLMGVVDTALAGRIDAVALAATGLGNTIFFLGAAFGMGVVTGVDPLASQAFGAGKRLQARQSMWHGLYAGALVTAPIALAIVLLGQSLEIFGVSPELAMGTREYIHARLGSLLPFFVVVAQRAYLQAAHRTWPLVLTTIVANLLNFLADWVLVFGDAGLTPLGIPKLGLRAYGVQGIGWATTVAVVFHCLTMALAIRWLNRWTESKLGKPWAFDRLLLKRIFKLGLPIALQMVAEIGIFSLVAILAGTMGPIPMAGHQVALMLAAFTYMVPLAIATATSVQVGRAIGRGDVTGTRRAGVAGIGVGAGFMFLCALVMWVFPETLARMMTSDPDVLPLAVRLIRIAGVFQVFDGIQAVSSGALRGAGITRFAMAANILAYWIVGFPIAAVMGFGYGHGPVGLWWGLTAGLAIAAVILTAKFVIVSRDPIASLDG